MAKAIKSFGKLVIEFIKELPAGASSALRS